MPQTSDKYQTDYYIEKKNDQIPLVFIHGVGLNKQIWEPQIKYFKNKNILLYDLIGHGKTPLNKQKLNFDDFVKQLLNLINELDIKKIDLVGFSLGSLIARHFAAEHNDRLNSLILHGSIYKRTKEQTRVVRNRFELIKTDRPVSKDRALRRWFTDIYIRENKHIYDKIYKILDNNNLSNFLKAYKLFVFYEDSDEILDRINTNTLVCTGQYDVGSTTEMAKNLSKKIKNSKYAMIRNGKHLCSIECAKDFNNCIEDFINLGSKNA